jgi:phage antirepressor YoqD-like protein
MFKTVSKMNDNKQTAGETAIQRFDYEGSPIAFASGESVMVNATNMAKKFGKQVTKWLNTQQTKDFLQSLSEVRKCTSADLVQVRRGGEPQAQGTWMHEDVAMEFARWLSPKFAIWCNDRIKELARTGVTTVAATPAARDDDEVIAHAMQVLQKRLEQKDSRISLLEGQVRKLVPLAEYLDAVVTEDKSYTMTETASFLGFGQVGQFMDWCVAMGILYQQNGRWLPMPDYAMKGYFATRVFRRMVSPVSMEESYYTVVTEQGRMMLFEKVRQNTQQVVAIEEGGAL